MGTKRTVDTGRKDVLGRAIKVSENHGQPAARQGGLSDVSPRGDFDTRNVRSSEDYEDIRIDLEITLEELTDDGDYTLNFTMGNTKKHGASSMKEFIDHIITQAEEGNIEDLKQDSMSIELKGGTLIDAANRKAMFDAVVSAPSEWEQTSYGFSIPATYLIDNPDSMELSDLVNAVSCTNNYVLIDDGIYSDMKYDAIRNTITESDIEEMIDYMVEEDAINYEYDSEYELTPSDLEEYKEAIRDRYLTTADFDRILDSIQELEGNGYLNLDDNYDEMVERFDITDMEKREIVDNCLAEAGVRV